MSTYLDRTSLRKMLNDHFGSIPGPRVERTRAHQLIDIIAIALLATLSDTDGWCAIETYGLAKQEWLESFLDLPNGIPSRDTFARIFSRLEPVLLETQFLKWIKLLVSSLGVKVIEIDGKSARGSYDRENGVKALQFMSAWASEHQLVLGQCSVESKSNEITAIRILLAQLDLSGSVITIDAMGTQTEITKQIHQADADYILALKHNHPTLADPAQQWFDSHRDFGSIDSTQTVQTTTEAGDHRIETHTLWQFHAEQVFSPAQLKAWVGLKTLVVVESVRRLWNKETRNLRFYISSLTVGCKTFARCVRSHWGIENQLHWCLVTVVEDKFRIHKDYAPRNMSMVRRLSLNLLHKEDSKLSLKMKRYKAAMANQFLLKVLSDAAITLV